MSRRKKNAVKLPKEQVLSESDFRKGLKKLQKHDVVSSRTDISTVSPSRWFRRLYERNRALIEGKLTTVKVSQRTANEWRIIGPDIRGIGRVTQNNRVTQQNIPETRLREVNGQIVRSQVSTSEGGIRKIRMTTRLSPVNFDTAEELFDTLQENADLLNGKLRPGEKIGFRYHGNYNRGKNFPNWQSMLDYLSRYESIDGDSEGDQNIHFIEFLATSRVDMPANPRSIKPPRVISYEERQRTIKRGGKMAVAVERARQRVSQRRYRAKQEPDVLRQLWRDHKRKQREDARALAQVQKDTTKIIKSSEKIAKKLRTTRRKI